MRKHTIITCICLCICLLFVCVSAAKAITVESSFSLAGRAFQVANESNRQNDIEGSQIIASYKGQNITLAEVVYNRNMNILRDDKTADKYGSDMEIANQLIANIIITEEAEKLGLSATQEEIDLMANNAILAYSLPEGKEIIDAYCKGAGITFERYIELLREQAPNVIARQKLKNEIGRQYCIENGLEYTNVNPPEGMLLAQEQYIDALVESHKEDIIYHRNTE